MKEQVRIEPHYLGSVAYFMFLRRFESVKWEIHEHFVKQTYRNRTVILGANGVLPLTVPVNFKNHTPFKDVKVDWSQRWHLAHWRSIESSYAKSPYFDFFASDYQSVLFSKSNFLLDLCRDMMTICLKHLQIDMKIELTDHYDKQTAGNEMDARSLIHPKKRLDHNFNLTFTSYFQNFGKEFVPNLSILDLLFAVGLEASRYLQRDSESNEHL